MKQTCAPYVEVIVPLRPISDRDWYFMQMQEDLERQIVAAYGVPMAQQIMSTHRIAFVTIETMLGYSIRAIFEPIKNPHTESAHGMDGDLPGPYRP